MKFYRKMSGFRCAPGSTWWRLKSPLRNRSLENPTFWNSLGPYGVSWYWLKCYWTKVISVTDIAWTTWPRMLRWAALDEYQLFFGSSSYGNIAGCFVTPFRFLDTMCTLLCTTTVCSSLTITQRESLKFVARVGTLSFHFFLLWVLFP